MRNWSYKLFFFTLCTLAVKLSSSTAFAHMDPESASEPERLDKVLIQTDSHLNIHKDHRVIPAQGLTEKDIRKKNHGNLNELVRNQNGIDVQDYCVNCGAKRLTINGLKGEHTTILTDGIPLFSSVSSVYGTDTISTLLIQEIEVLRGAGSALIYPDSIGGSLNLITKVPVTSGGRLSYQHSTHNNFRSEAIYSLADSKLRTTVGGDIDWQRYWDEDHNEVSESPTRHRISTFFKTQYQPYSELQLSLRGSYSFVNVFGGSAKEVRLRQPISMQADETDFIGGDVRQRYIGDSAKITDYLEIHRADLHAQAKYSSSETSEVELNLGGAVYMQDAIYSHAFDYNNTSPIVYADVKWHKVLNDDLFTSIGTSLRQESLRSDSIIMYDTNNLPKDNFDYTTASVFGQLDWHILETFEISSALRLDHHRIDRHEGNTINQLSLSPRFNAKYSPTENISHYWSYGMGHRMPLSFTEAAHGTYDGFIIDTNKLERSHSLIYMLSFNYEDYYFTPSLHYTLLQNMAYDMAPEIAHTAPIVFLNNDQDNHIFVFELLMGYKPHHDWLLELSLESFNYDSDYKSKLPAAAIENRIGFKSAYECGNWRWYLNASYVLPRNLRSYAQYDEFYNVYEGIFGVSDPKNLDAPGFLVVQTSVGYTYQDWDFVLGVDNLFDETQLRRGDGPAVWHFHDGHAHFDNRHAWGINRGREGYFKASYTF